MAESPGKELEDLTKRLDDLVPPSPSSTAEANDEAANRWDKVKDKFTKPPLDGDEKPLSGSWHRVVDAFLASDSLHGVQFMTDNKQQGFPFRRLMWSALLLGATGLFVYQSGSRVAEYFHYRSNINVAVLHHNTLHFPAVTVCNQNFVRMTKMYDKGLYEVVDQAFGSRENITTNLGRWANMSSTELLEEAGHDINDLIESCQWDGRPCEQADMVTTHTDLGMCYTFNAGVNGSHVKHMQNPGLQNGLRLVMNIEAYDHMNGPVNAAGIKVKLHEQHEVPLMRDLGFSVPSGSHTLVAINLDETNALPHPWGSCADPPLRHRAQYSQSACLLECMSVSAHAHCGCVAPSMFPVEKTQTRENETVIDRATVCDLQQYFDCILPLLDDYQRLVGSCTCPLGCHRRTYQPSISYSSSTNLMGLMAKSRKEQIRHRLIQSREVSQRVDPEILSKDKEVLWDLILQMRSPMFTKANDLFRFNGILWKDPYYGLAQTFASKTADSDWWTMVRYLSERNRLYEATYRPQIKALEKSLQNFVAKLSVAVQDDMVKIFEIRTLNTSDRNAPSVLSKVERLIKEGEVSAEKPKKLLTAMKARPEILFKGLPESKLELLPAKMVRKGRDVPAEVYEFMYYGYSGGAIVVVDTEKVLKLLQENFVSLVAELKSVNENKHLRWPNTMDYREYEVALERIDELLTNISENALPLFGEHVDWFHFKSDVCIWLFDKWGLDAHNSYRLVNIHYSRAHKKTYRLRRDAILEANALENRLQNYLRGSSTKHELARYLNKQRVEDILTTLKLHLNDGDLDYRNYNSQTWVLVEYYTRTMHAYIGWYMLWETDLLDDAVMAQSNMLAFARGRNGSECDLIYENIIPREQLTNTSDDTRLSYAHRAVDCFIEVWSNWTRDNNGVLQIDGLPINEQLSSAVSKVETLLRRADHRLAEFEERNVMDDTFVGNNFVQLDVFYEDFSYKRVVQQEAFHYLSLFGEIGGFMGLLLGGSVLTLFEFLDAITSNLLVDCCKTRPKNKKVEKKASNIV